MEQNQPDMSKLSWIELKEKLDFKKDQALQYAPSKDFVRRITLNYQAANNYYFGAYNDKLWKCIQSKYYVHPDDAKSMLYERIAAPFGSTGNFGLPQWRVLKAFKCNSTLNSWTSRIVARLCLNHKIKDDEEKKKFTDLFENRDYEALLLCDQPEEAAKINPELWEAFDKLPEKYQRVLRLLVINKYTGLDAYEELESEIHPRATEHKTSDEVKASWDNKRKQQAISSLKDKAIERLRKIYINIKNK